MRNPRSSQRELGEVRIKDIELDIKSRDEILVLLIGLRFLYSQEAVRDRLFALMDEFVLPGNSRKLGRPSGHGDVEHSGNGCSQAEPRLRH